MNEAKRQENLDYISSLLIQMKSYGDYSIYYNGEADDKTVGDCLDHIESLADDTELAELGLLARNGQMGKLMERLSYSLFDFRFER